MFYYLRFVNYYSIYMCDSGKSKFLCFKCIEEMYLSKQVKNNGKLTHCAYCNNANIKCFSLSKIANLVNTAFEQHYDQAPEDVTNWPIERRRYIAGAWEPNGDEITDTIIDAVKVSEEIAIDIQSILEEKHHNVSTLEADEQSKYRKESIYDIKKPDDTEWQEKWVKLEDTLKTKNRFFNTEALSLLNSTFENLDKLKTNDNKPIVKIIGPNTDISVLHRARVFQSHVSLKLALESPDTELGPPPNKDAKGGRMNANGIPVFYGATSPETALSEIRPPVGSKVIVGEFKVLQNLKMLDLTALYSITVEGSIFDMEYANLLSRITFLKNLSQRITRPIMPNQEQFEYLPTQAIADFLGSQLKFDGIIFPSAQFPEGINIVLFNHASRVEEIEYPKGSSISADLSSWEDGEQKPSYSFNIGHPFEKDSGKESINSDWDLFENNQTTKNTDFREVSLAINVDSLKVKHINSVKINSTSFSVERFESEDQIFIEEPSH